MCLFFSTRSVCVLYVSVLSLSLDPFREPPQSLPPQPPPPPIICEGLHIAGGGGCKDMCGVIRKKWTGGSISALLFTLCGPSKKSTCV